MLAYSQQNDERSSHLMCTIKSTQEWRLRSDPTTISRVTRVTSRRPHRLVLNFNPERNHSTAGTLLSRDTDVKRSGSIRTGQYRGCNACSVCDQNLARTALSCS